MVISTHAAARMSQRNVGEDDVALVIAFGRRLFRTGVEIYFLGRRDVPAKYAREAEHLVGTVVIVARDSSVINLRRGDPGLQAGEEAPSSVFGFCVVYCRREAHHPAQARAVA